MNLISKVELVHFCEESATMKFQAKEGLIRYLKGKTKNKLLVNQTSSHLFTD